MRRWNWTLSSPASASHAVLALSSQSTTLDGIDPFQFRVGLPPEQLLQFVVVPRGYLEERLGIQRRGDVVKLATSLHIR